MFYLDDTAMISLIEQIRANRPRRPQQPNFTGNMSSEQRQYVKKRSAQHRRARQARKRNRR